MSVVVNDALTGIPSGGGGGISWSDAVDSSVVPDTDNTYNLGSSSARFSIVYGRNYISKGTTSTASGLLSFDNSSGNALMRVQAGNTTPSGVAASAAIFDGSSLTGDLAFHSVSDATANSTATKSVAIETGNKTAGTGDSGDIKVTTGTSSGGSRGNIELNAPVVRLQNEQSYAGAFGSGERTIARVDSSGIIQMGQSGVDFRISGPVTPAGDNTQTNGNIFLRWSNVSSYSFEGGGGMTLASQTTPSGNSSVAGIQSSAIVSTGIWTGNSAVADGTATRPLYIETGNKTAGTGDSGDISLRTGTSAGGARGSVEINATNVNITVVTAVNFNYGVTNQLTWQSGVTASRPGAPVTGTRYFDTTINLPIWYNGSGWQDAAGNAV